ncbi:MAG: HAD-IA family hydrolase [Frankia sp.]|nr:HAD-IA family hydrolase [Frankia sp.]
MDDGTQRRFRGLLVDYGGVLTNPLHHTMGDFCRDLDLDAEHLEETIRALYGSEDTPGIVHGLETGAVEVEEFEVALAERDQWAEMFDAIVISGEVGLRKPQPAIFVLAAERIGVAVEECVFVDDLLHNVKGAQAAGLHAIHHTDADATISELEGLFGVGLR